MWWIAYILAMGLLWVAGFKFAPNHQPITPPPTAPLIREHKPKVE